MVSHPLSPQVRLSSVWGPGLAPHEPGPQSLSWEPASAARIPGPWFIPLTAEIQANPSGCSVSEGVGQSAPVTSTWSCSRRSAQRCCPSRLLIWQSLSRPIIPTRVMEENMRPQRRQATYSRSHSESQQQWDLRALSWASGTAGNMPHVHPQPLPCPRVALAPTDS